MSDFVPDEKLREAVRENLDKISGSDMFLVLFNESMADEVIPLIQMGVAVYLDKPIYLLVPESCVLKIPQNLRAMAQRIEVYPDGDIDGIQAATTKLLLEKGRG